MNSYSISCHFKDRVESDRMLFSSRRDAVDYVRNILFYDDYHSSCRYFVVSRIFKNGRSGSPILLVAFEWLNR